MQSCPLHQIIEDQIKINKSTYKIKPLQELKSKLNKSKDKLDDVFKNYKQEKIWKNLDPFKQEKTIIATMGNTINVTNAWIKCYELLLYYDILPKTIDVPFVHFDNAAFPGSFIISTHHLVATQRDYLDLYDWHGSSLFEKNEQDEDPLEDKYLLYKYNPKRWLMSSTNNGDVLLKSNQLDFNKQLGGKVDLYTSDLGFDVSNDYGNQENMQFKANVGQILSGLLTLKKGGSFITKQYTAFESRTVSLIYLVSTFFEEFYICKPVTSRKANSETYLVGKKFKGGVRLNHEYITLLFECLVDDITSDTAWFGSKDYPKKYLKTIIDFQNEIFTNQIDALENGTRVCINFNGEKSTYESISRANEKTVLDWYDRYPILPIRHNQQLKMIDGFSKG